jgi:glycosyltransferase involved in cell wall biosynthesis
MVVHGPYPVGEPRVARQVRVAVERGFEVDVLATRRPGEEARVSVGGAYVLRLPVVHRRGGRPVAVICEYLGFTILATAVIAGKMLGRRYDVVQVHNPPDFLVAAAILPKMMGARVILDIHDLAPEMVKMRFGDRCGAAQAAAMLRVIERKASSLADTVITVHEPYRRELVARGIDEEKLAVVMNAFDERLLPSRRSRRAREAFRVVYHGTLSPPYGVHLLVQALPHVLCRVPEARLEIYGEGDLAPALRAQARALGVGSRVQMSDGYLPHEEVLAAVSGASAGVIPNLATELNRFALSSKLFEYVALGIPVVSAALPTIRDYFSPNEILFFEPGDAGALAAALLDVAAAPEAAAARATAAARRADDYGWAVNAQRYASILGG